MSDKLEQVEQTIEREAKQAVMPREAEIKDLEPDEQDAAKVAGGFIFRS
jgi:hypothetical protein